MPAFTLVSRTTWKFVINYILALLICTTFLHASLSSSRVCVDGRIMSMYVTACVFVSCVFACVCGLRVAFALTNVYDIHFRSHSVAAIFVSWSMSTPEFIEIKYCQSLSSRRCIIDRKGLRALLNAYFCDEFRAWIKHAHIPGERRLSATHGAGDRSGPRRHRGCVRLPSSRVTCHCLSLPGPHSGEGGVVTAFFSPLCRF